MPNYYVNRRALPNGEHHVHLESCERLPTDLVYIGNFAGCAEAVQRAREQFRQVDGCAVCTPECCGGTGRP